MKWLAVDNIKMTQGFVNGWGPTTLLNAVSKNRRFSRNTKKKKSAPNNFTKNELKISRMDIFIAITVHPFSAYAKFSEKLTFLAS